jgi:hypothetical protein
MNTGKKTEKRFENEGENELLSAKTGLKPQQTRSQSQQEN